MIWHGDVCAEDAADAVGKWSSHRFPLVSYVPDKRPSWTAIDSHTRVGLTDMQIGCERKLMSFTGASVFTDLNMRTNQLLLPRSAASFAC
jgi:hypothetical protein